MAQFFLSDKVSLWNEINVPHTNRVRFNPWPYLPYHILLFNFFSLWNEVSTFSGEAVHWLLLYRILFLWLLFHKTSHFHMWVRRYRILFCWVAVHQLLFCQYHHFHILCFGLIPDRMLFCCILHHHLVPDNFVSYSVWYVILFIKHFFSTGRSALSSSREVWK